MSMSSKVLAAYHAGMMAGAMGKKATPAVVPGLAACVAAYMAGWAKGWAAWVKYTAVPAPGWMLTMAETKIWKVLLEPKSGRGKAWNEFVEAETAEEAVKIAEKENPKYVVYEGRAREA